MKVQVVRDRAGQVIAAVSLEPINPDGALVEPALEEGQQFEDIETTASELLDPQLLFEKYGQKQ